MPPVPVFSVIIPCHGREELLNQCLAALAEQTLCREDYEVIVVDDGSPTPLAARLPAFEELNVRVLRQEQSGPAKARNTGASHARGEFLAFTDSDCRPAPEWLDQLRSAFQTCPPHTCLAGRTLNALTENPYSEASQILIDYLFEVFRVGEHGRSFVVSGNMACPSTDFQRLGGFSEAFPLAAGEDRHFGFQWIERIGEIRFAADAVVHHHHALTLRTFILQHYNYGKGARTCHRLLRQSGASPPEVQPPTFYWGILRHPFTLAQTRLDKRLRLSLLMGLTQVTNVLGFLRAGK